MADLAQLGIVVDSKGTVSATSDLDKLTAAAGRAETATSGLAHSSTKTLAPAMDGVTKGSGQAGNGMRMMAQQMSRVVQQTTATGNAVQDLASQLPDMGMGFGVVGTAIGVVASVALPLLVNALTNTNTAMDAVKKQLDGLDDQVNAYIQAAKAASAPTEELAKKYGTLSAAAREALAAMSDVERVRAINDTAAAVDAVTGALLRAQGVIGSGGRATTFTALADDFGMASDAAERFRVALVGLNTANGLQNQVTAARQVQQAMLAAFGSVEAMPPALRDAYEQMARIVASGARVQGQMESAAGYVSAFSDGLASAAAVADNLAGRVSAVAQAAWDAASAMAETKARAESYIENAKTIGAYQLYGNLRSAAPAQPVAAPKARSSGGGGAGASDAFQQRLTTLMQELQGEAAVVEAWYAQQEALLNDRRARELLGEQGHKDAMLALEKEYHQRIVDIQIQGSQRKLNDQAEFWGALGGVIAAGGGQATKAYAAVMGAQAVISAYAGAAKALADPNITWWGRIAAYSSVLAAGLGAVSAIKNAGASASSISAANYGTSFSGSSISGTSTAAQAVNTAPVKTVEITVKGLDKNAMYSGAQLEKIFEGLVDVANLRGVKFI